MIAYDNASLSPRALIESYSHAFNAVNGRSPRVRYMGNHWFVVNGETVHRVTLMEEIARLRDLAQRQTLHRADKGVIKRLIARLKNL